MAIDPGSTTGVCCAVLDNQLEGSPVRSVWYTEIKVINHDKISDYESAAIELFDIWKEASDNVVKRLKVPPERRTLLHEDYQQSHAARSTKREALSPVYISWYLNGLRYGQFLQWLADQPQHTALLGKTIWQRPGSRSVITPAILKRAELWAPKMPHARTATQHLLRYARSVRYHGTADPPARSRVRFWPKSQD